MNTLESLIITNPFGNEEECAKFVIDSLTDKFIFHDITSINQEYTFSCWLKSDAEGSVTIGGKTFVSSEDWKKCVATFTAESVDFTFQFLTEGTYYLYHSQLEIGNKATDWQKAPEDTETKITKLTTQYSDIRQEVDGITTTVAALTKTIKTKADGSTVQTIQIDLSLLEQDVNGFKTTVSSTYATKDSVTSVNTIATQTADKFNWIVASGTSSSNFTITDRMAKLATDKLVIKSSSGTTIISGGVMDIEEIFAQNITATGTINGVTLSGASINIGDNFTASPTLIKMGGFKIDNDSFFSGNWGKSGTTPPTVFMCTGSTTSYSIAGSAQIAGWAFGAGTKFGVTNEGALYSSKGEIGGWSIGENALAGESGNYRMELYAKGKQFTNDSNIYFVVFYKSNSIPVGGLAVDGWHNISA